jgi:class 3 adenylate cyclase
VLGASAAIVEPSSSTHSDGDQIDGGEAACSGIAVSIGGRVASNAGPSEVLITQTVRDLVAGSGLAFREVSEYELKGVPDRWHLYRVLE